MDWVPIPNRMDGDGYTELLDHANGAAHFGAWIAMIQIASRCETRGTLLRDGARPHDAISMARISRIPKEAFTEALPRLLSIGWIELFDLDNQLIAEFPQVDAENTQDDAERCPWNGMERNGTEIPKTSSIPKPPDLQETWFNTEFWPQYWRRVDRKDALRAFKKHATSEAKKDKIVAAERAHAPHYMQRDPEHRPHAATWLNKLRYEESPEDASPPIKGPEEPSPYPDAAEYIARLKAEK